MKTRGFIRDERGTSAVEFALTAPPFLLMMAGIAYVAIWLWTGFALQHGAELAARCATYNPTSCANSAAITSYAASQSYGLNVAASNFAYSQPACGNQVTASVTTANFLSMIGAPALTASAQACFPK